MSASSLGSRVRQGLRHRLLCSGLVMIGMPVFVLNAYMEAKTLQLLPVLGCLLLSALAFMTPLILTEGFNQAMPSSRHLSLCPAPIPQAQILTAALLMMAPSLARLQGVA
ncbi:hypothetical protein H5407_13285 [Mitsuaria sp. WAJ17]|uniref:hypothetical protein n=1 Tax=Mitsuaria sp. WAJ17 TaxID=2761452 RepID=UPI001603049D|nr:hypothetical protein [Mitsuaria sp. WAJ17]MBB2486190.1 hypothetical protein [Mitsuaria sp. WAJ17]